jgi:isoleucyl-tRNA synthetase
MFTIVDGLARLLAPILSVTMDELWRVVPGERVPSVHMALFPMGEELAPYRDATLLERWSRLGAVRDAVNLALEQKRQEQAIKANLSAQVALEAAGDDAGLLDAYREFLPTLFGVSAVELRRGHGALVDGTGAVRVVVSRADGVKCDRCWRYVSAVSDDEATRGLCPRCVEALGPVVRA